MPWPAGGCVPVPRMPQRTAACLTSVIRLSLPCPHQSRLSPIRTQAVPCSRPCPLLSGNGFLAQGPPDNLDLETNIFEAISARGLGRSPCGDALVEVLELAAERFFIR